MVIEINKGQTLGIPLIGVNSSKFGIFSFTLVLEQTKKKNYPQTIKGILKPSRHL